MSKHEVFLHLWSRKLQKSSIVGVLGLKMAPALKSCRFQCPRHGNRLCHRGWFLCPNGLCHSRNHRRQRMWRRFSHIHSRQRGGSGSSWKSPQSCTPYFPEMKLHMGLTKMNKSSLPRNARNAQIDLYIHLASPKLRRSIQLVTQPPDDYQLLGKHHRKYGCQMLTIEKDIKPASTMDITWHNGISNGKLTFQTQTFFK